MSNIIFDVDLNDSDKIVYYSDEDIINEKAIDDDSFDFLFHDALDSRFADINRNFSGIIPFFEFDCETRALYKYFEYSHRHINRILKDERKEIEEILSSPNCPPEFEDSCSEMQDIDSDYLLDINSEATLLMLYTLFENLLSSLAKYAHEDGHPEFIRRPGGKPLINQYLSYLQNECGFDFYINKQFKDQLYLMRKIRNYFVHENKGTDTIDLDRFKTIKCKPVIKEDRISISREYILSCFDFILEMAKLIELSMAG